MHIIFLTLLKSLKRGKEGQILLFYNIKPLWPTVVNIFLLWKYIVKLLHSIPGQNYGLLKFNKFWQAAISNRVDVHSRHL